MDRGKGMMERGSVMGPLVMAREKGRLGCIRAFFLILGINAHLAASQHCGVVTPIPHVRAHSLDKSEW